MLANNASKILPIAKAVVQTRAMSIVSGPPRIRVSPGEKALLGGIMLGSMLIIPGWVLVNLKNYKDH